MGDVLEWVGSLISGDKQPRTPPTRVVIADSDKLKYACLDEGELIVELDRIAKVAYGPFLEGRWVARDRIVARLEDGDDWKETTGALL